MKKRNKFMKFCCGNDKEDDVIETKIIENAI
jgi:hypothetical protein